MPDTELTEEQIKFLVSFPKKTFKKGESIIIQGETIENVYFLAKGDCSRKAFSESGEEFVYDRRTAKKNSDNFIAEIYVYISNKISAFTYVTESGCEMHIIPQKEFTRFLTKNPEIMHGILFRVINRYNELNQNFITKKSSKTISIVSGVLYRCAVNCNGKYIVGKKLSITELAKRIGSHRVTVSKLVTKLINEGILRKTQAGIEILDMNALGNLANESADVEYMI